MFSRRDFEKCDPDADAPHEEERSRRIRKGRRGRRKSTFSTRFLLHGLSAITLALVIFHLPQITKSDVIPIGGLFDLKDDGQEAALRYAVNSINSDRTVLAHVRLAAQVENIPFGDSFRGSRMVCSLVKSGVAAILGPQSDEISAHVRSMCDALEIPHIETRWDFRLTGDPYSVNLYPHPSTLAKAYMDVLKCLGWRKFCIIYENNNGLIRVQELLKDHSFSFTLKQLPASKDYRPMLKEAKKAGVTHVVLDVRRENIFRVLQQAQQIGLMTSYHNYFFTSLDLHTVEVEDFQFGGTNITSLRIVDPDNPLVQQVIRDWLFGELRYGKSLAPWDDVLKRNNITFLKTEMALMYDAVHLFAKALDDLDRSHRIHVTPLDCDGDDSWLHGNSLINYMKWVQVNGLTGLIKFDTEGFRRDISLDIVELTQDGLMKVGRWDPTNGANYTKSFSEIQQRIVESLRNKTLIVSSVLASPYVMLREEALGKREVGGNDQYEGYCVDLMEAIAEMLGFNYTIQLAADESHGHFDKTFQRWDGMIGDLLDQKADLAIGDLTITYEREQVVDFTMPWMNLGISILYKKPSKKQPSLFSFLSPVSLDVWLYMATAYLALSMLLFVIARLSPNEWINPHPCETARTPLNEFSLSNCLWFCIGSLMQQGADTLPRALSTRMVACLWWFFTLVMISSYTANLAAFLTVGRLESPIESADDLAKQTQIKYGALYGGSTRNFFRTSKMSSYQRIFSYMESQSPSVYTNSNEEGVKRVVRGDGQYAYMMESSSIEYIIKRHCDLIQVGSLLDSKSYGIALPPGSPYRTLINSAVLKLQEMGKLYALKRTWWNEKRGGGDCQTDGSRSSSKANELNLSNVGGVFVLLLTGMGLASVAAVCEFVWKSRKLATEERESLLNVMGKELKLTFSCGSSSKSSEATKPDNEESGTHAISRHTCESANATSLNSFTRKEVLS